MANRVSRTMSCCFKESTSSDEVLCAVLDGQFSMLDGFTVPFIAELALVFPAVLAFVAIFFAVELRKMIVISADVGLPGILFAIFRTVS